MIIPFIFSLISHAGEEEHQEELRKKREWSSLTPLEQQKRDKEAKDGE